MNQRLRSTKGAWHLLLLLICLVMGSFAALSQTFVAHASPGSSESWSINANGTLGDLEWFARNYPTTSDGSSPQDFYVGTIFGGDTITGSRVIRSSGGFTIAFVRLYQQPTDYLSSFQVYHGVESADGLSMSGYFQVYNGTRIYNFYSHKYLYSYTVQSPIYPWTATLLFSQGIQVQGMSPIVNWVLNANGWPGSIGEWYTTSTSGTDEMSMGSAFVNGMVGFMPLSGICYSSCPMYFIRTISTDLTDLQIYNGWATGAGTAASTLASGGFVEVVNSSSDATYSWNATSLGGV